MIDKGKHNLLGVRINAMDYEAAVDRILSAATKAQPLAVSALAVHGVMTGVLDAQHRYRLNDLDLVLPDGHPVRWALNFLGRVGLTDRVYGPALMQKICHHAAVQQLPIYLYGGTADLLAALRKNLLDRFPTLLIAGVTPSQFRRLSSEEREETVAKIRTSGAAITFVGLGCPRQEVWAFEFRQALSMPVIAVGAAFNFHAGTLPQAPPVMQRLGLEWLFRLIQEPRRLWKRYVLLNPMYLSLLILQLCRLCRFDTNNTQQPTEEILYG